MDGHFFDSCQDDEVIGVEVFGQAFAGEILVDDGAGPFEVVAVTHDGNTAAATGDDQLSRFDEGVDGADFDDFLGQRRSDDAAPAPAGVFLDDVAVFFGGVFRLFFSHEMANRFRRILESRVFRVDADLGDHGSDGNVEDVAVVHFFAQGILQVIADVSLAHGDADRQRRVGLVRIFPAQGGHGVVDHADLRAVAVGDDDFTAFLDEIDDGLGCRLDGQHLFVQCISQGVAAEGDDDTFLFLGHDNSPFMCTKVL